MRLNLIQIVNWLAVVLILIGAPTITSLGFGNLHVSHYGILKTITLCGLGFTAVANWLLAFTNSAKPRERRLLIKWGWVFATLLLIQFLVFESYLRFQWFKDGLLRLKALF